MQEKSKLNIVISILVFLIVIGILVFITINNKATNIDMDQNTNNDLEQTIQKEGVKITVLQEGQGEIIKTGETASVNYTGTLADGTVFDSNIDSKFGHVQPFSFTLGAGQVIQGWEIGVEGMKVGEKRHLEISPEYAYGEYGAGGVIPPNATISFDVELLTINK